MKSPRLTSARNLKFRLIECLEPRNLLAVNIVGHWTADDLNHLDSGDAVPAWIDSTSGIAATPDGQPRLIKNALNGHSVVRFDPTDGDDDRLRVLADHNPLAGAGDFTVATVFATSSQDLRGDSDTDWFLTSGLVDASLAGIFDDWGLTINGQGQVVAGLGRPKISQTSAQTGLNDGGAHAAVYTRSGGTISLYVDGVMTRRTDGSVAPRAPRAIAFGAVSTGGGYLEGDIAEVRLFDSELSANEVLELTSELRERYFNFAPTAFDDEYSVVEDQLLTVTAGNGVLTNDSDTEQDTFIAVIVSEAAHGTVDLSPDGSFTYQPHPNFAGTDSFTYVARDTRNSEVTTVTINVLGQDDPAVAVADAYLAIVDQALMVTPEDGVLSNDVNLGDSELTAVLVRDVQHGDLTMFGDGSFRYVPDVGFAGRDSFTYRAVGGLLGSHEVHVDLQVNLHPIVISEVMAANRATLLDEDGDSSDWIELFNYGNVPVDIGGWYLTDDPDDLTGWQFPETVLLPGHFLTVFASGKDRPNRSGELHTDFRLASDGEYLALVAQDRQTVVSEVSYPLQLPDISYAISHKYSESVLLNASGDAQVLIPSDDTLGLAWTAPGFDPDDSWSRGTAAIGFDTGDVPPDRGEYAGLILDDEPVGYWRLEESDGSVAQNSGTLAAAANGTYLNGVRQDIDGVLTGTGDSAALFSSTAAQKIDVPNVAGLNNASFSFEAWARVDGGSGYRSPITSRGDSPQEGFIFYATPSNTWHMWTGTGQQVGWTVLAGPPVQIGKWTHLVGTYDDLTKTQRFYVDGVRVASVTNTNVAPNNADPLRIGGGATEGTGNYFFEGAVDEVAVYDDVLPATTIAAHYALANPESGNNGVAEYADIIEHDVREAMLDVSGTAYIRIPFEVSNPAAFNTLELRAQFDDGFVAYLNGQRVLSRNAPSPLVFDSAATDQRPDALALVAEAFDLSDYLDTLAVGENVLAVHALNASATDGDFLFTADLVASATEAKRFDLDYADPATPGRVNGETSLVLGPTVSNVSHSPTVPAVGEPLYVTAHVRELGMGTSVVTLDYRLMYGDEFSTRMSDDGTIGNDIAGDGIYTGVITPAALDAAQLAGGGELTDIAGQMLRYSISTRDLFGGSFRAPFLVGASDTTGIPEYFGTVIQKDVTTPLPVFQWFVPDPNWHVSGGSNNKNWSPASAFFDGEFYDNIQVRARGQTTIRWDKPKFKFEFNDGHDFRYSADEARVDEFNLQSHFIEKGAVSYMGANLAFGFLQDIGVPASNTFHMHVRQNGDFYSLASFIEQVDATFLDRNGFDPTGPMYKAYSPSARSTLEPNPTAAHYRKVIDKDEPWDDFETFIDGINGRLPGINRSDYIFDHVNLPEVINDMAGNIILINHDRLTKNYYMYRDDNGNGEWSRFPWDMDQAFARRTDNIFASVLYGDSEHPQSPDPIHQNHLYDAILDTPFTREMYLQRIRTLLDDYLGSTAGVYFEPKIDAFAALIGDDAALDNARWGAGPISAGVARLKDNLQFRRVQLEADPLVPDAPTTVDLRFGDIDVNPASGNQDEEYIEIVNHGDTAVDISGWRLDGGVRMTFQPGTVIPSNGSLFVSPNVVAFRSRSTGPSGGQGLFVQGDYSGHLSNFGESVQLVDASLATVDILTTPDAPTDQQLFLRVSELHYNPPGDDATEFIEILNISSDTAVSLTGVTISDGPSEPYTFSEGSTLQPGERRLVVKNRVAFSSVYPGVDVSIIDGVFVGSLSNGGERIKLNDENGSTIVEFSYGDGRLWPNAADGVGASLELVTWDTQRDQIGDFTSWRSSREFGGSPGTEGLGPLGVVINEVRTNTNDSQVASDSIELLNTSDVAIDISGWYLSDTATALKKFAIPAGTVLGPREYVVFDESDFNPTPDSPADNHFALDGAGGDDVWLVTVDSTDQIEFLVDDVHFDATLPSQTLGRLPNGAGRLSPLGRNTLGCGNGHFLASPVVISEVAYDQHPSADQIELYPDFEANDLEYIELHNASMRPVDLTNWTIDGGISGEFAAGTMLMPNESALMISFDPNGLNNVDRVAAFRLRHGNVRILGQFRGKLSNSGDLIQLFRPDVADVPNQIPLVLADEVLYDNRSPWPDATDSAIHRAAPIFLATDGNNWERSESPGSVPYAMLGADDITGDDEFTAADLDSLLDYVRNETGIAYLDQNGDSRTDLDDIDALLDSQWSTARGDVNLDGLVDAADLNQLGIRWQQNGCATWRDGDLNGDSSVDAADLNQIGVHWQHGVAAKPVRTPQPALAVHRVVDKPRLDGLDHLASTPGSQFTRKLNVLRRRVANASQRTGFLEKDWRSLWDVTNSPENERLVDNAIATWADLQLNVSALQFRITSLIQSLNQLRS